MNDHLQHHYTAVGHLTIDVFEDGSRRPGGTVFYSALQAARLGLRARVITCGVADEVAELIAPYRHELDVHVLAATHTTTLLTTGSGVHRRQRMLAWAGPMPDDMALDTAILHLAPVARECPSSWRGHPAFVGLTPQGLARGWSEHDGQIVRVAPDRSAESLARQCHAIVVNHHERVSCAQLIATASAAGALVAITAAASPTVLLEPDAHELALDVPALLHPVDDIGAGDVFAAAFFTALSDGRSGADAASFANAAAAVRVQGAGAGAIGRRADIERRLHATAGAGD